MNPSKSTLWNQRSCRSFSIHRRRIARAFTLVELVMVVTIIGIIAAIAVPRISSAAASASVNALEATLTNVRKAIDVFYAEHGKYPGYDPGTGAASGTHFVDQLLKYTDARGNTSDTRSPVYMYGPYLRAPFPKNPTNKLGTVHVKPAPASPNPADGSVGWIAVLSTGDFGISASDVALDEIGITAPSKKDGLRLDGS